MFLLGVSLLTVPEPKKEEKKWNCLKKSVQSVLEKDRIGSPVFLRCVLHIATEGENLLSPVAEVAALANEWMPSSPVRVYAQGDARAAQVTIMIHYVGGQMALLSTNRVAMQTAVDIMLVGNKGVVYHETPIGQTLRECRSTGVGRPQVNWRRLSRNRLKAVNL